MSRTSQIKRYLESGQASHCFASYVAELINAAERYSELDVIVSEEIDKWLEGQKPLPKGDDS